MSFTDATIRAKARALAPELVPVADALLDARIPWCKAKSSARVFGVYLLDRLGYMLAHAVTRDLAGTQGEEDAGIGAGATAGAIASTSVGSMAIGYGSSGAMSPAQPLDASEADLSLTPYGRAAMSLLKTRPLAVLPGAY